MKWTKEKKFLVFYLSVFILSIALIVFYRSVLVPLSVAAFLTYLLAPVTDWLERRTKISRGYAVLIIIFLLVGITALLLTTLLPTIYQEVLNIFLLIPKAINYIVEGWLPIIEERLKSLGVSNLDELKQHLQSFNFLDQFGSKLTTAITKIWETTPDLLGGVVSVALLPVVLFFLLKDIEFFKTGVMKFIPEEIFPSLQMAMTKIDLTLKTLIKGQLMVAALLGVMYMMGLSIVGIDFSLAIGAIAGICRIVPYLDVIVGISLSFIVIITHFSGWGQMLGVAIVFLIAQTIDGMFLTPRILGEKVGLHPGVVIVSFFAFSDWLGFYGVLLAIPLMAILKVIIEMLIPAYQDSKFFHTAQQSKSHGGD